MVTRMGRASLIAAVGLFAWSAGALVDDAPLTLYWFPRPPFYYEEDGRMHGVIVEPTERVLDAAGIPYVWKLMPFSRVLATVRANSERGCGVGWYWSPERARMAQYSPVIYYSREIVAAVRSDVTGGGPASIRDFLGRSDLKFVAKQDFSYGAYVREAIAEMVPRSRILTTPADVPLILKMVQSGRGDFTLAPLEEVEYLLKQEFPDGSLRVQTFYDVPRSEGRHLMCSKSVPAEWMTRIGLAISENRPAPP